MQQGGVCLPNKKKGERTMKKLSLFLALLLMLSSFGAVLAEEAEAPAGGPPGQAAMTEEEACLLYTSRCV